MRKHDKSALDRTAALEEHVNLLAWLHAELEYRWQRATILQVLQTMQPQIADLMMNKTNGANEAVPS